MHKDIFLWRKDQRKGSEHWLVAKVEWEGQRTSGQGRERERENGKVCWGGLKGVMAGEGQCAIDSIHTGVEQLTTLLFVNWDLWRISKDFPRSHVFQCTQFLILHTISKMMTCNTIIFENMSRKLFTKLIWFSEQYRIVFCLPFVFFSIKKNMPHNLSCTPKILWQIFFGKRRGKIFYFKWYIYFYILYSFI